MAEKQLTAVAAKNAKPKEKPYRLADGGGLYLLVSPTGAKSWQYVYRRPATGRLDTMTLGRYDNGVLLSDARTARDEAKRLVSLGKDPKQAKREEKAAQAAVENGETSFRGVAEQWYAKWKNGVSEYHAKKVWERLEKWVFPSIGKIGIADIDPPMLSQLLGRIESAGVLHTAHRARIEISMICTAAVNTGLIKMTPTGTLRGRGVLSPERKRHYPTLTDPMAVAALMRQIDDYSGSPGTRRMLWLAAMTFQRPAQIRLARWGQIDWESECWACSPDMMKGSLYDKEYGGTHLVPLSNQALSMLRELHDLFPGELDDYVFSGRKRGQPVSAETVNKALRSMGYAKKLTGHGFRAMARTLLAGKLGVAEKFVEHQLDHAVKGPLGNTYDRNQWVDERRGMMQVWSDYLHALTPTHSKEDADAVAVSLKSRHDLRLAE